MEKSCSEKKQEQMQQIKQWAVTVITGMHIHKYNKKDKWSANQKIGRNEKTDIFIPGSSIWLGIQIQKALTLPWTLAGYC